MSDEQTIYISPEDDLTTVRERLEHIQSRSVTLVVPAQTQLRSHVAWKLLNARARELGKEVLIVSSDPQVRSVAHAVKFKVAHSLETTQQGNGNIRPASRPTRSSLTKNTRSASSTQRSTTARGPRSTSTLRAPQQETKSVRNPRDVHATQMIQEQPGSYQPADLDNEDIREAPASSIFQVPERPSQRPYEHEDYHYNTTPSIHPLTPDQIDDDPDMLAEDYKQASDIRRAASRPGHFTDDDDAPETPFPLDEDEHKNDRGTLQVPRTDMTHSRHEPGNIIDLDDDDLNDGADILAPPLPEQRGHAFVEGFATNEHPAEKTARHHSHIEDIEDVDDLPDIANLPTSIIEPHPHPNYIDEDDVRVPQSPAPSAQDKNRTSKPLTKQKPPVRDTRNRRTRTGYISPGKSSTANPWSASLENDDLLPVEQRPTHFEEHDEMAYDRPSRAGKEPRPVQLPIDGVEQSPQATQRGATQRQGMGTTNKRGTGTLTRSRRPLPAPVASPLQTAPGPWVTPEPPQRKARPGSTSRAARKRPSRGLLTGLGIAALLVILLLVLGYFIPTSTITLALATHTYNRPFTVLATTTTSTGAGNTIQARTITKDFTRQGVEPVTGSKMVDSGLAQGTVCFSNSGSTPITVPTGTIIEATGTNGTQFKVTAESVILPQANCTANVGFDPIQAMQPGESGNVQAGTITVIPSSSLQSIAQANNTTPDKLTGLKVTNPQSTQGGGRQPVNAITNADLQNAKNTLHKQLQGDIDAWLKSLPNNYIAGKPTISDSLVNPPVVGATPDNNAKNFQANVKVSVSILVVSSDDLKQFAIPQINNALQNDKNLRNYVVPNNSLQAVQINNAKVQNSTPTNMQISYTASAQVITTVSPDQIRQMGGHTIPDAQQTIESQINGVQSVTITTTPAFFPWVAFWPAHIDVKTKPVLPIH